MTRLGLIAVMGVVAAGLPAYADTPVESASPTPACPATPFAMGVRFQAASAEVDALRYQAYNVATRQLDTILAERQANNEARDESIDEATQPPAVVLDLDETVLDNSPMAATGVLECIDYTDWGDLWQRWVAAASAPLIPGAKAFLEHADTAGVTIYYVSNRGTANLAATVKNLQRHGLPQARAEHGRLMGPPKTRRRAAIAKDHDIVMLVGDSLHDFDGVFADASLTNQRSAVKRLKAAFGRRFIVLPNASYGSWQDAELSPAPVLAR